MIAPLLARLRSEQIYSELPGIIRLFEDNQVPYWLGGGIAYDLMRGEWTRPHKDIDLSILAEDLPRTQQMLESAGFTFKHMRRSCYFANRGAVKIDLFVWRKRGAYRESAYDNSVAWVEDQLFQSGVVSEIRGQVVTLTPPAVMHTFLPLVRYEADREFIQRQKINDGYCLVSDVRNVDFELECLRIEPIEANGVAEKELPLAHQTNVST